MTTILTQGATVNLGDFSRRGKSRAAQAVKALDHDRANKQKMIPFGLLNLTDDELHVTYGCSYKTSDFICDAIEQWWASVKTRYQAINERVIYADITAQKVIVTGRNFYLDI